jgi:hypothetical protein
VFDVVLWVAFDMILFGSSIVEAITVHVELCASILVVRGYDPPDWPWLGMMLLFRS